MQDLIIILGSIKQFERKCKKLSRIISIEKRPKRRLKLIIILTFELMYLAAIMNVLTGKTLFVEIPKERALVITS